MTAADTARAAATAKGQAETQAQEQHNAQQKAESQARSAQLTGTPQSHGFDTAGNRLNDKGQIVQFANRQAQETFLSDRGVGNNGIILDQAKAENADFSSLAGVSNARQQASSVSPTFKPEENYGYTSKVSPIISENFAKNPLETNYNLEKTKAATQARSNFASQFSSDQGGVKTKQSEGKSFGYSWAGKQSESIGSKIFSNQDQLSRNSAKEEQAKQSAAEKAFTSTTPTSNNDYATGGTKQPESVVTLGKAEKVFGGGKTSFGWSDISKDQLVRNSIQEKALNTTLGARSTYKEGQGTPFSGGLIDKSQTKNASDVFFSSQKPQSQSTVLVSKPQEKTQDFNSFFAGAESRGSTINIYNAQGARVGSVKANEQGRQTLELLSDTQGVYFRESKGTATYDSSQRRAFADFVSKEGSKGTVIDIFSGEQKVGQVSGPNAYRDTIGLQTKYGSIYGQVDYSTTPEGKSLLNVVSKGGVVTFSTPEKGSIGLIYSGDKNAKTTLNDIVSKAPNGFNYQILYPEKEKALLNSIQQNPSYFEKQPASFWENAYRTGSLQPNDSAQINSIFQNYNREQNAQAKVQQRENAAFMSNLEYPGNTFVIKDQSGKVIGTTSGQRSRYDFLKSEGYGSKSSNLGPYSSNTVTPKYNGTFAQGFQAIMQAKAEPKSFGGILSDIGKTAISTGAGMAGLGLSALGYAKGAILDVNKPTTQNYNKFKEDISYFVTGGYKLGSLTQGRIEQKDNPSLTHRGESIISSFPAPTASRGYVNAGVGVFTGVTLGFAAEGARPFSPLRFESIPVKVAKTEGSPAFPGISNAGKETEKPVPMSQSLVFGYGAASRELISKVPTGYKVGKLKPQDYFPEGYAIKSQATRGEEFATGKPYPVSKLTSSEFQTYAEQTGRSIPGTAKATQNFIELKNLADTKGEYTQYKTEIPTSNERITGQVGKVVLESNAKLYPVRNAILRVFSTGRGAVGQGSTFGNLYTHPEVLPKTEVLAPVHDIDFVKGNAISETNPILGKLQDRQARALASTVQQNIEKNQGIYEQKGVGFHATQTVAEARDIVENPSTLKSKRGGFFVMNKASAIGQFGGKVVKVEFNPEDVLFYKNIPKSERKALRKASSNKEGVVNWLTFQENVKSYAQAKGYNIVEKPYYNTRYGAGTSPNAGTREIIFINEDSLKSIKSSELLPEIQLTRAEGSKIYGVKDNEKLVEFITKSDTDNEVGSAMKPTGNLLGKAINFKVYKTKIEGSNIKGPHYGGQHAEETGLSQILAIQTSETIKEQGPTTGGFSGLGNKFFVGPKLFGQGKELVRTLAKFETKAKEFQSNPTTKDIGDRMIFLIGEQREYYGKLYGVDFNKPVSGSDLGRPSSYYKGSSKLSNISSKSSSGTSLLAFSKSSPSSVSSTQASKSGSSKQSQYSIFSGKSDISGKSANSILSGKSSKSNKSSLSTQSSLSGLSGKSGPSGKSSTSGRSTFSIFSGTSGPSGPSAPSGPSGPSGSSGISAFSGTSGTSGFSGFNSFNSPPSKPPSIFFGNIGRRRKSKLKSGPTGLIQLNVHNVFTSSLDIEVPSNRRVLF